MIPLGADYPKFIKRKVRYMLLKDENSISVLDIQQENTFIISHSEFDRMNSTKGTMPNLSPMAIKWIDDNYFQQEFEEPLIHQLKIFFTEG